MTKKQSQVVAFSIPYTKRHVRFTEETEAALRLAGIPFTAKVRIEEEDQCSFLDFRTSPEDEERVQAESPGETVQRLCKARCVCLGKGLVDAELAIMCPLCIERAIQGAVTAERERIAEELEAEGDRLHMAVVGIRQAFRDFAGRLKNR